MLTISGKCDLNEIIVKSILNDGGQNSEIFKSMLGTYKKQDSPKNGQPWYLHQGNQVSIIY